MKITERQARTAAKWWRDRLDRPVFDTLGKTRGDPRERGAEMAEVLATMLAANNRAEPTNLAAFETELCRALLAAPEQHFNCLSVDYGPCLELAEAAVLAKVDCSLFPWKTAMWLKEDGTIKARCGYGGETKDVPLLEDSAS